MSERSMLEEGLEQLGIDFSQDQIEKLLTFMDLVLEENKKMNLTAITDRKEFIQKHLLDSLSMWTKNTEEKRVLDMGTGGGFPGIPLKILHPTWDMTLMDSTMKKIRFVQRAIDQLGLQGIEAIHGRAEEYARNTTYRESFDMVFSRAVASLNTLLEYCVPFLKVEGCLIAAKGPKYAEELELAEAALKTLYASVEDVQEVKTPGDWGKRFVMVIRKSKTTPSAYPRKQGLPGKKPL